MFDLCCVKVILFSFVNTSEKHKHNQVNQVDVVIIDAD